MGRIGPGKLGSPWKAGHRGLTPGDGVLEVRRGDLGGKRGVAVTQVGDAVCLDESNGDEFAKKCSELVAHLEGSVMEFGQRKDGVLKELNSVQSGRNWEEMAQRKRQRLAR